MSNSYSIRGRRPLPTQTDLVPNQGGRQNRGNGHSYGDSNKRHKSDGVGAHNATSILYLGNVPKDWNEKIIESVVKGSGNIVDIRTRIDPSGRSKNYVFVEYQTPEQASKAMGLISAITFGNRRFKVELSKEGFNAGVALRKPMLLSREFLPDYVVLPQEMLAEDYLNSNINSLNQLNHLQQPFMPPQRSAPPVFNQQQQQPPRFGRPQPPSFNQVKPPTFGGNNQQITPVPEPKNEIAIPDILSRASQTLPTFNASTFTTTDKISQNLSTINPPALIQMLSLLKSSDETSRAMALNANPAYTINVVQALLLMGVIDKDTLQSILQQNEPQQHHQEHFTPQQPKQHFNNAPRFPSYNNHSINTNTFNPAPPPPPPPPQQIIQSQFEPKWANFSESTRKLLSTMPPVQAQYMVQVLSMSDAEINALPYEHKTAIMQIRSNYL